MASGARIRDRAGEFTESLCALEWIAEQLLSNDNEGPGAAVNAVVQRLMEYNEVMNTIQDGVVDNAKPEVVFEQVNEWLRQ